MRLSALSSISLHWKLSFSKACQLCIFSLLFTGTAIAEDNRQLAKLPLPAQEALRQEMIDNLIAINEILSLVGTGKFKEAGDIAEQKLGFSAQGKNRSLPFEARAGANMPQAMHALGIDGHRAASEFAKAAKADDHKLALELLPSLTQACVACHASWRIR